MAEVGRDDTVRLEDDPMIGAFEGHSAFSRMSVHYLEESAPVGHRQIHDATLRTAPAPFDRSNRDDVDRVQYEGSVRVARVRFSDEAHWRAAIRRSRVVVGAVSDPL